MSETVAKIGAERCLWVRDATVKGHLNPEVLRCRPEGRVVCQPCLKRFRTESDSYPYRPRRTS